MPFLARLIDDTTLFPARFGEAKASRRHRGGTINF
jgi:hypothetical protein